MRVRIGRGSTPCSTPIATGRSAAPELGQSLVFSSVAGNPQNTVNYDRTFQSATGPQETSSKGLSFFIQDSVTFNRLTLNVGLRAERWEHFATTGENIYTFPWEFAPRLSAVYDLLGDGRHRVSGYYGRYYDPIRNNMTNFAGTLTGSILEEQVYAGGEWITYRTRGGPAVQDAFFAPTTQTPYTDDLQFDYAVDLGNNMSLEARYINRRTRDILEDYDLELYATAQDGQIHYPGPTNDPNTLFLGLDYFGYTENPGSNFVIATLEGGERNYQGLEFVLRKRFADRWQFLTSYNYNDAEGNTNSDSNADFQGDVIYLDPRAPNQFARQPGNITHLLKGGGSYTFDMGLQLGAVLNWNSGTFSSRTYPGVRDATCRFASHRRRLSILPVSPSVGWHRMRSAHSRTPRGERLTSASSTAAISSATWARKRSSISSTSPITRAPSAIRTWSPAPAAPRSASPSSGSPHDGPSSECA